MKEIRIAGVQGFYGDSYQGAIAVATASAADYLVHDALSELTLSILQKDKLKDSSLGYARDIERLSQHLYPIALSKGIKIVSNSGGLNPRSAALKVKSILASKSITNVKIAAIDGDDFLPFINDLKHNFSLINIDTGEDYLDSKYEATHANVYIGASTIKKALEAGADIILAGRVADPCLTLGIMAYEFNWPLEGDLAEEDLDKLANGIMIGHILECGGQATGGNSYSEWLNRNFKFSDLGYPIAHVSDEGSAIITKVRDSGGKVSRNTIREQLVYEIHNPKEYITPDVIVDFTQIKVEEIHHNQVKVSGAKGKSRPEKLKLCIGQFEGYISEQIFYFSWPYAYKKAQAFVTAAKEIWDSMSFKYDEIRVSFPGLNGIVEDAAPIPSDDLVEQMNEIGVRIAIKHQKPEIGKMMIQSVVSLGLNGPPGISANMNWGKIASTRLGLFPVLIPRNLIKETVTIF